METRLNRRIVHGALAVGVVLAAASVLPAVGPHGHGAIVSGTIGIIQELLWNATTN